MNGFVLLGALAAFPFTVFAGTLQIVTLVAKNMISAVCPIAVIAPKRIRLTVRPPEITEQSANETVRRSGENEF
jgi:hypothetical protein